MSGPQDTVIGQAHNSGNGQRSGAAPDNTPGSTIPTGPSANQDATRNQKQFISRLGQDDQIQDGLTKGEASNIISDAKASGATNNNNGSNAPQGPRATGAAADNTPGSTIPTGPSANQDATVNQKQFISRLGQDDQIKDGLTKGEASDIISDAKASGATNNNGGNASSGSRASGAAPDKTPGSQIPTGPSAGQPATGNQKGLLNSLGAADQLSKDATKGDASELISRVQGGQ